jgi:hypothetical protein
VQNSRDVRTDGRIAALLIETSSSSHQSCSRRRWMGRRWRGQLCHGCLVATAAAVPTSLVSTLLDVPDKTERGEGVLVLACPHQGCRPRSATVLGVLDEAEREERVPVFARPRQRLSIYSCSPGGKPAPQRETAAGKLAAGRFWREKAAGTPRCRWQAGPKR